MDNQNPGGQMPPIEPKSPNTPTLNKGLIIGLSLAVVVLLAVVIYLVYQKNNISDYRYCDPGPCEETANKKQPASESANQTVDWKTYKNEQYGFEMQFTDAWKDYKTTFDDGSQGDGGSQVLSFYVPTKDAKYGSGLEGFANPLTIVIYLKSAWQAVLDDSPHPAYISEKGNYIFAYSVWQDPPQDLVGINFEINRVMETFKFIMPNETAGWKTYTNSKYGISIKYPPYNNELKALDGNINVEVLDDTKPEDGPSAFWVGVAQKIWHERYEKRGVYKIVDECVNDEQETCKVYSSSPFVLKILENYADPYPDPYKLVFPTEKFQLTVGPLPQNITDKELNQIIATFKFTN